MPGDETYVHLIDALAADGPMWLLVAGLLVVAAFVAVRFVPIVKADKEGRLDIERQREGRKAEEARMRGDRDREHAATTARMVDAMNRQADGDQAMAAALNAITERLDASQGRSARMGERVEENHETLATVAQQVDDIHAVTVRGRGKQHD